MPKNKGKGGKKGRRGKKGSNDLIQERRSRVITFKTEDLEKYAQVTKMLGNGWVEANCFDGKNRRCHIRGNMRKKVWIAVGDIVLISLREWGQDDVGDIIHKYYRGEAHHLQRYQELPDTVDLSYNAGAEAEVDDRSDGQVDFDFKGYMKNPDEYHRIRSTGVLKMTEEDVDYYESLKQEGLAPNGPTH